MTNGRRVASVSPKNRNNGRHPPAMWQSDGSSWTFCLTRGRRRVSNTTLKLTASGRYFICGQCVYKNDLAGIDGPPGNIFSMGRLFFIQKGPSNFKVSGTNTARAAPGAQIDTSWRTIIARIRTPRAAKFCRTAVLWLEIRSSTSVCLKICLKMNLGIPLEVT
jgi:hypothetical protein